MSTEDFNAQIGRLKEALGLQEDQEVAAALGMSKAALSARKARGAFPEKDLRALVSRRPELRIDVLYVLTGERERADTETQDEFIDRMQAIKATGRIVDAMGLPDRERDGLKGCLTGDPAQDGVLIAKALARQAQQAPQVTYPKATVTPLPANEHAGLTWRELMILAVDELNAAGLHLPGEKLAEMVDLLMEFQREGLPVSRDSVARQIRLVA